MTIESVRTVILGAGLSGLATATFLKESRDEDFLVLEASERVGGLARTDRRGEEGQYLFDVTGHWLHLRHPHIRELVMGALDGEMLTVERKSGVYSHGVHTPYPFQANVHGLPPEVVKECLLGFVEAQIEAAANPQGADSDAPRHFGEYIQRYFGAGIAKHFMIPYNTRLWGVRPEEITAEWCGRFIPRPGLEEVIDGALGLKAHKLGYNASFVYPVAGGVETLSRALAAPVLEHIRLKSPVVSVNPVGRRLSYQSAAGTKELRYERLVSSMPLPRLVQLFEPAEPAILDAASRLRATRLRYLNVAIRCAAPGGKPLQGKHWIYIPEERWPFYRLGCFSNAVPYMAPEGEATLYVELSNLLDDSWDDARILGALIDFLRETGDIVDASDVSFHEVCEIPVAYVIFDHDYYDATQKIHRDLADRGLHSIGRYGRWIYNSMEDSLQDGYLTARELLEVKQ